MTARKKGKQPKPLNPDLYSPAQIMAAKGKLPADHRAWGLNERDEARYLAGLLAEPLPDFNPPTRRAEDRTVHGSCSICGTAWRGELVCHCASCHLTFRSVSGFDEHRTGGRCRTTAQLAERGLEPNADGQWRRPRPPESIPGHLP